MSSKDVLEKLYKFFQTEKNSEKRIEQRKALHYLKKELEKNGVKKEEFDHELNILYSKEEKKEKLTSEEISTLRKETLSEEEIKTLKNDLLTKCPYAKFDHFKESDWKFYAQLLSCAKLMYAFEQNGIPEDHAYKLSMIFSDLEKAIKYLNKYPSMHDACLFSMPTNDVTWEVWRELAQKYLLSDKEFGTTILPQASKLEELIKKKPEELKSQKERKDLLKEIKTDKKELEKLSRNLGIPENKDKYDKLSKKILEKQIELAKGGLQFNEHLELEELKAVRACFLEKYSASYKYFLDKGLTEKDYNEFSGFNRDNAGKNIPNIEIDGKNLNPPHSNFYLRKLDVSENENDAAMAACLGKLTNCCQYLGGVGDSCVRHGLTNENGGFYVVCHKNKENKEVVVGQSWVWRSKDKALVFDSIEISNKGDNKEIVKSFFNAAAKELVKKDARKVVCGSHSGISNELGIESVINKHEKFTNYSGYSDASSQRVIMDEDKPFYRYGLGSDYTQRTKKMIGEALLDEKHPLVTSSLMMVLNWAVLEKKENLIKEIEDMARYSADKLKELGEMKGYLQEFLKLTDKEKSEENKNSFRSFIEKYERIKMNALSSNVVNAEGKGLLSLAISIDPEFALDFLNQKKQFDLDVVDNKGNTALMLAVSQGNREIVKALINNGANVDLKNKEGNTALMEAASKGDINIMEMLINAGKKEAINLKDNNGNTALMLAVSQGNREMIVEALINNGANVNLKNNNGNTALMWAASKGDIKIMEMLIKAGKKEAINLKDNNGNTALMLAVSEGNSNIVDVLINNGANVDLKNNNGSTALMKAVSEGNSNIVDVLIKVLIKAGKKEAINAKDNNGNTALMKAVSEGNIDIVDMLIINNCADVDIKDNEGNTALMKAISQRMPISPIIMKLIYAGVDLTLRNNEGNTALMLAVSKVHDKKILTLLIEKGIEKGAINLKDKEGNTALMKAVSQRPPNFSLIEDLINAGADVTLENNEGNTVLMQAVSNGQDKKILDLIINAGIKKIDKKYLDVKNNQGDPALIFAIPSNPISTASNLNLKKKTLNLRLEIPGKKVGLPPDLIAYLIEKGADVNAVGKERETALMLAASRGHKEIVEALLDIKGIKLDVNNKGNTALMNAISNNNKEIALALIEKGANCNCKNEKGDTPLILAVSRGHKEILGALIKKGAYLWVKEEERRQLLKLASKEEIKGMLNQAEKNESEDLHKVRALLLDGGPRKLSSTQEKYKKTQGPTDNVKASARDDTSSVHHKHI